MKFIVNGGRRLEGEIKVLGSKNAATPIISATILTSRPCVIENVPKIGDVATLLAILASMGSEISWLGERTLRIVNKDIDPKKIDLHLVRRIRSSVLLVAPILARFGEFVTGTPGGCHIGVRPLDAHLESFKDLGIEVNYNATKDLYRLKTPKKYDKSSVILKEFSVTATENLMMLGYKIPSLEINLAAAEPHVQDLGAFLKKLGMSIEGLGTHLISIKGANKINSSKEVKHSIISDPIEAGTFFILGALTGNLRIKKVPVNYLTAPLHKLKEFGVDFSVTDNTVTVKKGFGKLKGTKIQTLPYPGFPTDLQAPYGVLATQSRGESLIFDTLYEGRLRYIKELAKMGAKAKILDPHRAIIYGRTPLHGASIKSLDLRAGATLVIAALTAKGKSILNDAEQIDRGYEKLEERLRLLGADITRTK